MPRLKREIVEARESFSRLLFSQGLSVDKVQDRLVKEGPGGLFGTKMALPRLQELQRETKSGVVAVPTTPAQTSPQSPAKALPVAVSKEPAKPEDMVQAVCENDPTCGKPFSLPRSKWEHYRANPKLGFLCPDCRKGGTISVIHHNPQRRVA